MPDGLVTVKIKGRRYRGAYFFEGNSLVVEGYGLETVTTDLAVLQGERGKAAVNLAKLALIEMVRNATALRGNAPELSSQGSTTRLLCDVSTATVIF